jgi:hypothetical protein
MKGMSAKKHLIRRYLLATVVGVVVGLVGLLARYEHYLEREGDESISIALIDSTVRKNAFLIKPDSLNEVRVLRQELPALSFLLYDRFAINIIFGSTLLVPFAVHTFDLVAASRRKREQGTA